MALDMAIFVGGWAIAQRVFRGYEAHVAWPKRLLKLLILGGVFAAIHGLFGRWAFYGLLGSMTAAMGILHGYWFHRKHGIHWRTAEPKAKYLALIGEAEPDEEESEAFKRLIDDELEAPDHTTLED